MREIVAGEDQEECRTEDGQDLVEAIVEPTANEDDSEAADREHQGELEDEQRGGSAVSRPVVVTERKGGKEEIAS